MNDRLSEVIKALNITKVKFAKTLNVSAAFVSQLCAGVREPSERTISDICSKFGVNPEWLKNGEGEMFRPVDCEEEFASIIQNALYGSSNFQKAVMCTIYSRSPEELKVLEAAIQSIYANLQRVNEGY